MSSRNIPADKVNPFTNKMFYAIIIFKFPVCRTDKHPIRGAIKYSFNWFTLSPKIQLIESNAKNDKLMSKKK